MTLVETVRARLLDDLQYLGAPSQALEARDLDVLADWKRETLLVLMAHPVARSRRRRSRAQ